MKPNSIPTIHGAVRYIDAVLQQRGKKSDEEVAAAIVGLESNIHLEKWCNDDNDLKTIISNCWDLEWSNGSAQYLADMWQDINRRMVHLKKRYPADN